jgi:uncharacterized protein YjbI with pentapeptide repeats
MRKICPEELKTSLVNHMLWCESGGVTGKQADFRNADLRGVDFRGVNLQFANFTDADLSSADLEGVALTGANLRGTKLGCGIVGARTIRGAHFTPDALPWLMLRPNWPKEQDGVHIFEM